MTRLQTLKEFARKQATMTALFLTLLAGIIPAAVVATTMRLNDGNLTLLQADLGPYSLNQLVAGLIAVAAPLVFLFPIAWLCLPSSPARKARLFPLAAPLALFGPSIVSGLLVGGDFWTGQITVLLILATCLIGYTFWLALFERTLGKAGAILVYSLLWALTGFLDYLDEYVLAYLDGRLDWTRWFVWLFPPIGGLVNHCSDTLIEMKYSFHTLSISVIQSLFLGSLLFFLEHRKTRQIEPTDATQT